MPLILEVMTVWLVCAGGALAFQATRPNRPWGRRLHLAAIFGIFAALVFFVGLIVLDVFNLR